MRIPEVTSPWWIPILLLIGWAPPALVDLLRRVYPHPANPYWGVPFAEPWFFSITLVCTGLALLALLLQILKALQHRGTRFSKSPRD